MLKQASRSLIDDPRTPDWWAERTWMLTAYRCGDLAPAGAAGATDSSRWISSVGQSTFPCHLKALGQTGPPGRRAVADYMGPAGAYHYDVSCSGMGGGRTALKG